MEFGAVESVWKAMMRGWNSVFILFGLVVR